MKLAHPLWLLFGGFLLLFLAYLWLKAKSKQKRALNAFVAPHLQKNLIQTFSPTRRYLKEWMVFIALAFALVALATPQWGYRWVEVKRQGVDILIALDTSRSMLAQDIKPNRLERAKLAITDLVHHLKGDRVGLIAFAGNAFLQVPLTLDHSAFLQTLEQLDTGIIPLGGSSIASALDEAEAAFSAHPESKKVLLMITDGEDLEGSAITSAEAAGKKGVQVFTVGVGSTAGELIPVKDEKGGVSFLKDESGQFVKSRLDEATLQKIADATKARYVPLGPGGEGLQSIYDVDLKSLPQRELKSHVQKIPIDRYTWPLAAAVLLLIFEYVIGERKAEWSAFLRSWWESLSQKGDRRRQPTWPKSATLTSFVLLFVVLSIPNAPASPQSAEKAYRKGAFKEAQSQYDQAVEKDSANPELQYNLGTAAYRNKDYSQAADALEKSLRAGSEDPALHQKAYYNQGNTWYRQGQEALSKDPQTTVHHWEQAVQSYEHALQLNAQDEDAKLNRDLVKKKLQRLKEMMPKQEEKNQDKKENQDQDQNDQEKKNKEQNTQQQNPSGQKNDDSTKDQAQQQQPKPMQAKGSLSKEQAQALLDALKKDEGNNPLQFNRRGEQGEKSQDQKSFKNW